ncbi:MAG: hypothetical protein JRN12_05690 [Nitrososphaerota archaeon]|jgi:hypothetical protein|nr:hypothetical protein [Nitrososphaerota archaeon]MDG6954015.1 hypothetical protein [Nitrososphaerota archaeon]
MTSGSDPRDRARTRLSLPKALVVVAIVGAVVFGLYIGYLAYANDSFPTRTEPFANYATVSSSSFNGTEFAFTLTWQNASALPLYAQLTSPATDAANTPVCGIGLSNVTEGQSIFMPFTITESPALSNVDLSIAVKPLAGGSQFTIVYNVPSISAGNLPISPSNISCQEPPGIE